MVLPNFLIIGAQKAGTTSLYEYTRSHPDVFMPGVKEIRFFNRRWDLGISWYESFFEQANGAAAVGEATPDYTMYPHVKGVPARIASVIPDAKLIYLLRDPIDRMRSHYGHALIIGRDVKPIDQELLEKPLYLDKSRYALQIEQFLRCFDRQQLLVLLSDDLRRDRVGTMRQVFAFLGVDPEVSIAGGEYHRSAEKLVRRPMGKRLQMVPGYDIARRLAPRRLKLKANNALTQPFSDFDRLEISPATRSFLVEELRDDVRRLGEYVTSPSFDGWGLL